MIKMKRVCIPLGLDCNFRCRYCYRGLSIGGVPTKISPLMKEFLQYLDPAWCQAVIMSGGEPLMYVDTMKEIFSLVNSDIHKKIMTNGSLLTQELVNYINDNDIEISLSHDGAETKYLRGRDILEEPDILKLVRQIKVLTICCVITNRNPDLIENYNDTVKKLGRSNFYYLPAPMYYNGYNEDLLKNFDYDTFIRSYREERYYIHKDVPYYTYSNRTLNFNVDLDGNVIDKDTLEKYGTVLDDRIDCIRKLNESDASSFCGKSNCPIKDDCFLCRQESSEHTCFIAKMKAGYE